MLSLNSVNTSSSGPRFGQIIPNESAIRKAYGEQGEAMLEQVRKIVEESKDFGCVRELENSGVDIELAAIPADGFVKTDGKKTPVISYVWEKDNEGKLERKPLLPDSSPVNDHLIGSFAVDWPLEDYDASKPALVASLRFPAVVGLHGLMRHFVSKRIAPERLFWQEGGVAKFDADLVWRHFNDLLAPIETASLEARSHYSR